MDNVAVARKAWSHLIDRQPGEPRKDENIPLWDCLADDVVMKFSIPTDTPLYGGEFRGKDAIFDMAKAERDYIETGGLDSPPEFVANGDRVVMLCEQTYTIKKTGQTVHNDLSAIVMDFRDGLITRIMIYLDVSDWNAAHRGQ